MKTMLKPIDGLWRVVISFPEKYDIVVQSLTKGEAIEIAITDLKIKGERITYSVHPFLVTSKQTA